MLGRRWQVIGWLMLVGCRAPAPPDAPSPTDGSGASEVSPNEPPSESTDEPAEPPLRLVEIAPGVHAALQPERRRFIDANAAVVVTDAGLVVIDAPQNSVAAHWLATTVDAMSDAPRRVLITTHWHLDHSLGATFVRAAFEANDRQVEHWGHVALDSSLSIDGVEQLEERRAMLGAAVERGTAMVERGRMPDDTPLSDDQAQQLRAELAAVRAEADRLSSATLEHPAHHVAEPTSLTVGELTLELIPLTAHTDADLVVHLPASGVLITGDVLDEIPFAGHGRPRRWLAALDHLDALGITTIIPGHGPVMGPEHLARGRSLWNAVLGQAMLAIQRGDPAQERYAQWQGTPEYQQLRETLVTDPASERNFDAFMPVALERAMADLRGDLDR